MEQSLLSLINECIREIERNYTDVERTCSNLRDLVTYPCYRLRVKNFPNRYLDSISGGLEMNGLSLDRCGQMTNLLEVPKKICESISGLVSGFAGK